MAMSMTSRPRRSRRTREGNTTRQRLIDAAIELIERDGVDGARIVDIVEVAETTTGSLYWFFDNRRALIDAALAESYVRKMRDNLAAAEDILEALGDDVDPFSFLASSDIDLHDPERVSARRERLTVLGRAIDDPELASTLAEVQRDLLEQISVVIRRSQERGSVRDDVDPWAVAVLMQAVAIGLGSIDLDESLRPDNAAWNHLNAVMLSGLAPPV